MNLMMTFVSSLSCASPLIATMPQPAPTMIMSVLCTIALLGVFALPSDNFKDLPDTTKRDNKAVHCTKARDKLLKEGFKARTAATESEFFLQNEVTRPGETLITDE